MKILAVDTATSVAGAAIEEEDRLLAVSWLDVVRTHSEQFLPMLQSMLKTANLTLQDMDAYAITVGPGSFTGLRIGMATVKAFYHAHPLPIAPVLTLDALAYQGRGLADVICPCLDARKNEVYYRLYNGAGAPLSPAGAMAPALLAQRLKESPGTVLLLGDGAKPYYDLFCDALNRRCLLMAPERRVFMADALARLGLEKLLKNETVSGWELEPFYLRKSEAECRLEAGKNK